MTTFLSHSLLPVLILLIPACTSEAMTRTGDSAFPSARIDAPLMATTALDTAYLAGGCFWGVEAVFEHVKGVVDVVSGYSGGSEAAPSYEQVSSGSTGHAESVRVVFDPSRISYGELLRIFFSVVHDPTQLNRQGPDVGPHYRSAIFYRTPEQQQIADAYITQLTKAKTFPRPIVTQVVAFDRFFDAEAYHQNFAATNPDHPYIVYHDAPKVERLRAQFSALYRER